MANRYNYLDLDPTYKNAFGQPLMRMTFDYTPNEHRLSKFAAQKIQEIGKGKPVSIESIHEQLPKISEDSLVNVIKKLKVAGDIFETSYGMVKKL